MSLIESGVHGFTDRKVLANRAYAYCVTAIDSTGNESACSNLEYGYLYKEKLLVDVGELKYKYSARKGNLLIWWKEEASNQLVGYVVYSGESDAMLKPISGLLEVSNFTDTPELSNPTVYYKVKAVSKSGSVIYSELLSWKNKKYEGVR